MSYPELGMICPNRWRKLAPSQQLLSRFQMALFGWLKIIKQLNTRMMGGLSVVGFPFQIVSQPLQADFFSRKC